METPRGRWFLDEFSTRLRRAETSSLHDSLQRLETAIATNHDEVMSRLAGVLRQDDDDLPAPPAAEPETRLAPRHMSYFRAHEDLFEPAPEATIAAVPRLLDLLPREGRPTPNAANELQNLREPIEAVLASSGITGESAAETIRNIATSIESIRLQPLPAQADKPKVVSAASAAEQKPALSIVSDKERLDYDEEDLDVLRALKIGVWLDLAGEDEKLHPAKLSWVSPISSRLMFVNRRGVRILVASIEELAAMKKAGNLVLREQEHVFDQAMHRVMGRLQSDVTG